MSEWREVALGDVIELKRGYDLPSAERRPGTVPIISSSGDSGRHCEAKAKAPGVVTGRYGTIGEVFLVESDFWPLNTSLYVRDFKGNDVQFVYYLLKTINWNQYNDKSGVPGINRNHVHEARVKLPGVMEQQAIARVLGSLDNKIKRNALIIESLEAMASAMFKDWFVDFSPIRAKSSGQTSFGVASDLAQAFPSDFEGDLPRGWRFLSAGDVSEVSIGKTPPRKESQWFSSSPTDTRWASIRDMGASGVYLQETSECLTANAIDKFNVRRVPANTVLLSFKLTVGRVAISTGEMVTNEAIAHFNLPEKSLVSPEYLYLYLKGFDYSRLGSTSSIATAVNSKTIRQMPVLVPNDKVQSAFNDRVRPLFATIRSTQSEMLVLRKLRDALLPKLISGSVRVNLGNPTDRDGQ